MKKYKLAFLFTQPPFGTAISREGLDALLAACAFCNEEDIAICFLHDGVFNLLASQQPGKILQKDHISAFKLIELYELSECFICKESIQARNLQGAQWLLTDVQYKTETEILTILAHADKVLTF